jgi:large subunit ribosomal protein L5
MLQEKYKNEVIKKWLDEDKEMNVMSMPRIEKVVINMGLGQAKGEQKEITAAVQDLQLIAGQVPVVRKAKKSIAGFNLREGMPVGVKVTLRGRRMYNFLDKLFNMVLPRVRDFHGLPSTSFDSVGNYSLGLSEQINFLEIDPNKVHRRRGLEVTIVTSAKTDELAKKFLLDMGLPLEKENV